jgi:hypothetical protein
MRTGPFHQHCPLLRSRRERLGDRRASKQRDEFALSDEEDYLIPPAGRVTAQR